MFVNNEDIFKTVIHPSALLFMTLSEDGEEIRLWRLDETCLVSRKANLIETWKVGHNLYMQDMAMIYDLMEDCFDSYKFSIDIVKSLNFLRLSM